MTAHRCRIDTYTDGGRYYPGHPGYVVICDACGRVGTVHEYPGDARAIANRHDEIGGFER